MSEHTLIVGGSSGIGYATADRLLQQGHHVTIAGRDADKLRHAKTALGRDLATVCVDAADTHAITAAYASIEKFDHLVLALGSTKGGGSFTSVSLDDVRAGFDEKVFPHFACAQAAIPFLAEHGSITFISAITAHAAMAGTAGLGAANAAIVALVPILAVELSPRRVNAVSPGVIDTPWWDFLSPDDKTAIFSGYAANTPVKRVGRPDDVARAIEALISNTFITGQVLACDGGIRLTA